MFEEYCFDRFTDRARSKRASMRLKESAVPSGLFFDPLADNSCRQLRSYP